MRTFTLTLRCDNAAFEDGEEQEIARILVRCAQYVDDGYDAGTLADSNGNVVGSFARLTEEG